MLPCVIQVGFAGSRRLFDPAPGSAEELGELHQKVEDQLVLKLAGLRGELGLAEHYFLSGVSQIAIGADTVFTRACERLNLLQRIFLPQPRDAYLSAEDSKANPDFTAEERRKAVALLESRHIIEERIVSNAQDRPSRFEECNREILRVSDVVICLIRAGADAKRGGTGDLLALAKNSGKKTLELRVSHKDGTVELDAAWHGPEPFVPPKFAKSLEGVTLAADVAGDAAAPAAGLPSVSQFCGAVKAHTSEQARRYNDIFSKFALAIIGTHVLATLLAALALALHGAQHEVTFATEEHAKYLIAALLGLELVLLLCGLGIHHWLHVAGSLEGWAIFRLLAEINRSVRALGNLHIYPAYLFHLRLPSDLTPLLRTINILHLHSTRAHAGAAWNDLCRVRDSYLAARLTDPDPTRGQIAYFTARSQREYRLLHFTSGLFFACSTLAIISTGAKLLLVLKPPLSEQWNAVGTGALGTAAIFLPTLAVGALSWAAAKEYKARVQAFGAMLQFLQEQKIQFQRATSAGELRRLVEETEFHLLGEVTEWYTRRVATGVA